MTRFRSVPVLSTVCAIAFSGFLLVRAQDPVTVADPNCNFFGADHEKYAYTGLNAALSPARHARSLSVTTRAVSTMMAGPPPGSATSTFGATHKGGSIDSYLQADWQAAGITPAPMTTDWEFIRRITLDLTGRIPTPAGVVAFV